MCPLIAINSGEVNCMSGNSLQIMHQHARFYIFITPAVITGGNNDTRQSKMMDLRSRNCDFYEKRDKDMEFSLSRLSIQKFPYKSYKTSPR
jgi:hypothetical protein